MARKEEETEKDSMEDKKPTGGNKADSRTSTKSSASGSVASPKSSPSTNSKGTYPNPKNFAERMMNALENGVDHNIISWLRHDNEDLVAINLQLLKNSDVLKIYFQGARYAAFVRNLSRWYV